LNIITLIVSYQPQHTPGSVRKKGQTFLKYGLKHMHISIGSIDSINLPIVKGCKEKTDAVK